MFETPRPNVFTGMVHGVLFILYIILAMLVKPRKKWTTKTFIIVLLCSIIPFGTFWMDKKYLRSKVNTTNKKNGINEVI